MTLEEQLAEQAKRGLLGLGLEEETAEEYAPWASLLAQFIPGVGEGVGIDNTVDAINDERYGDAAVEGGLTLLGAVPVVGDLAAAAIKGIRKAPVKAFDEAAWLKENPRPSGKASEKEVKAWYGRLSYLRNKAKVNARSAARYEANKDEINAARRSLHNENSDEINAARRKRYNESSDETNARRRGSYTGSVRDRNRERIRRERLERREEVLARERAKRIRNAESIKESRRRYAEANKAKIQAKNAKRRAAKLQRTVPWSDKSRTEEIYSAAQEISEITGIPHHVDHVIPLQGEYVSGLHHQDNLLIVPAGENISKGNRFEPGALPPKAGVRNAKAYLKKIKAAQEAAKRK